MVESGGRRRLLRYLVAGLMVSGAASVFLSGADSSGAAPSCTKTWTGAPGASYGVAGNWSPAGIPGSGAWVCSGPGSQIVVDDARVAAGGTLQGELQLAAGGSLTLTSAANATTVASLMVDGGTLDGAADVSVTSTATLRWGQLSGSGELVLGAGTQSVVETVAYPYWLRMVRPVSNAGLVTVSGDWTSFILETGSTLTNTGTVTFPDDTGGINGGGGTVVNTGLIVKTAGTATNPITAGVTVGNAGIIRVAAPAGTLQMSSLSNLASGTLSGGTYDLQGTLQLSEAITTNAATLILDGSSAAVVDGSNANAIVDLAANTVAGTVALRNGKVLPVGSLANAGTVTVDHASVLRMTSGDYVQTAGSTRLVASASTLDVQNHHTLITGGVLGGIGRVQGTNSPALSNTAKVDPGPADAIGDLTVTGVYTQAASGELVVDVDGTGAGQYDTVAVSGVASLHGRLTVRLGYTPAKDETFTIMTTGAYTGTFDSVVPDSVPAGLGFAVDYSNPNAIVLKVVEGASLRIAVDAPTTAPVNGTIIYTITVTNDGPAASTNVVVSDVLPTIPSTTFLPVGSSAGCSLAAGKVSCTMGTLAKDESKVLTIALKPTATGIVTNQITAQGDLAAAVAATKATTVTSADLRMNLTPAAQTLSAGGLMKFTAKVTNLGPATATGVAVAMTLPSSFTFSESESPGCTSVMIGGQAHVTCSLGVLTNGASATSVIAAVPGSSSGSGYFAVFATATPSTSDPNPANNSAQSKITVNAMPTDVAIALEASAAPVYNGQELTYTATITNNGPGSATNVRPAITLPAGVTWVSTAPATKCTGSMTINCVLPNLAATKSTKVTIKVRPQSEGGMTAAATVSIAETDNNPLNNSAQVGVTVLPAADLTLSQPASPASVLVGQSTTVTISPTNKGPSTAQGVNVTETFGSPVTIMSMSPGCTGTGPVVCSFGDLGPSQTSPRTITVRARKTGSLAATGVVASATYELVAANNTKVTTITVRPPVNGKIAFQRAKTDGTHDLWTRAPAGTLAALPGHTAASCPTVGTCANSSADDVQPAWSPDGKQLAFSSNRAGDYDVYVINSDYKTGLVKLTPIGNERDELPSWSPDGTQLAFTRNIAGVDHIIVKSSSDPNGAEIDMGVGSGPDWSPWLGTAADCSAIAYQKEVSGQFEIFIAPAPATSCETPAELRVTGQVTNDVIPNGGPGNSFDPAWSPTGTSIVFDSFRAGDFEVYRADLGSGGGVSTTPLTHNSTKDGFATYSPDGSMVVYSNEDGVTQLTSIPASTGDQFVINNLTSGTDDTKPDWQGV